MNLDFKKSIPLFRTYLFNQLDGVLKKEAEEWTTCSRSLESLIFNNDVNAKQLTIHSRDSLNTLSQPRHFSPICPEDWAREVNKVNCEHVYVGWYANAELGGDYYQKNYKVAEKMLLMAGVRMASVLNYLFDQ